MRQKATSGFEPLFQRPALILRTTAAASIGVLGRRMTGIQDALATLRWYVTDDKDLPTDADYEAALARVEAEIARLKQERELHCALDEIGNWRERAGAAEAEAARLNDGLRDLLASDTPATYAQLRALLAGNGAA